MDSAQRPAIARPFDQSQFFDRVGRTVRRLSNPIRSRLAANRKRVLRGARVTLAPLLRSAGNVVTDRVIEF